MLPTRETTTSRTDKFPELLPANVGVELSTFRFREELEEKGFTFTFSQEGGDNYLPEGIEAISRTMDLVLPDQLQSYDPEDPAQLEMYHDLNEIVIRNLMVARGLLNDIERNRVDIDLGEPCPSSDLHEQRNLALELIDEYAWYLVLANQRWVNILASRNFLWNEITENDQQDVMQMAYLGAFEMAKSYDPDKARYTTYLKEYIPKMMGSEVLQMMGKSVTEYTILRAKKELEGTEYEKDVFSSMVYAAMLKDCVDGNLQVLPGDELKAFEEYRKMFYTSFSYFYDFESYFYAMRNEFASPNWDEFHNVPPVSDSYELFWLNPEEAPKYRRIRAKRRVQEIVTNMELVNAFSLDEEQLIGYFGQSGELEFFESDLHEIIGDDDNLREIENQLDYKLMIERLSDLFSNLSKEEKLLLSLAYGPLVTKPNGESMTQIAAMLSKVYGENSSVPKAKRLIREVRSKLIASDKKRLLLEAYFSNQQF